MNINSNWTLLLDRDGVINEKLEGDYVKYWDQFVFCNGALRALEKLAKVFLRIIVVTNQRGVGKGLMTGEQLELIHQQMMKEIAKSGGKIDKIYSCLDHNDSSPARKPNIGMGLKAKSDFPEIDFSKSIMVGDSVTDIEFANKLGMKSVYISSSSEISLFQRRKVFFDFRFNSLLEFSQESFK